MNIRRAFPLLSLFLLLGNPAGAQSSRSGIGAIPYADAGGTGVTFRTWAPNASSVTVKGAFNGWGSTALAKDLPGGSWNGYWSVDVARAKAGDEYKFIVNGTYKKDPRGRRVVNSAGNSIVYNAASFNWGDSTNFSRPWRNDLVIYQMHVGTYNAESWLPSTFDQCIEKIPYIKALGVSAVKLMPVNEFPGDRSWGYNPSDPYAIESSFGGPDGLKRFVKACHENGLAVLIDVVHNHYGPSDLEMWQYDGWSTGGYGGIYFYNDWKANTDWGSTRPDYGRAEVRDYVKGQIRMFLEEYKVDGFRWDSVYNIRHASGTWNQNGSDMLWDVNTMVRDEFNDAYRIAEDHAFDTDVRFETQWDHEFLSDIRWLATAASDSDRDMNTLAARLTTRYNNTGFGRVVYAESHDSCGDLNNKHRLPYDVDSSNPEGYWAKKRSLLAHTIVLVSPGIPMIFAGSEMNEWYTFSNNQALRWSLTNQNAGIVRAFSDLIHLRRNLTGISAGLKNADNINVHHIDNAAKVLGCIRWELGGQADDLVVAINCSANARMGYSMPFPSSGTWYCLYNSDSTDYDPLFGGVGPAVGGTVVAGTAANLDLGAYSLQIYSKSRPPEDVAVSFDPAAPDGCETVVTIAYEPHDGPLRNPTNVWAYIGRNGWLNASNQPMTLAGDAWTLAYAIPQDTYELNLSFTDGGTRWDNNEGANWRVPVTGCGGQPAPATQNTAVPQGCVPVKVSYEINAGPLTNGATPIYLFIGRNGWQNAQHVALTNEVNDLWSGWYAIPDDTWELNYVFHNASDVWDNNNHEDWGAIVAACVNSEQPSLAIAHPAAATNVADAIGELALQGTANLLTGHLRWTNQLNGASGAIAYATNWNIAAVPLAPGVNVVRVSGTNSAANPNDGAADSPSNAVYLTSQTWFDGQNGGAKFKPWSLSSGAAASLAVSNAYCSFAPDSAAWALQASGGGFIEALRPFATALQPGDKVAFVFENGGIDGPGESSVGVAFHNRFGQRLAEFYFHGGTTNYVYNDTAVHDTGIPWGNAAKTGAFEMVSTLDYRLTINGQSFESTFADASDYGVAYVRFWNYNAGAGDERKLFIGPIAVTGAPLPVLTYSSEIAVTRAWSPVRTTQSVLPTEYGLVATLNSVAGIANNVWGASGLTDGGWNWALLPTNEYTVVPSNNTVSIALSNTNQLTVISIGKPGGSN